MNNHRVTGMSVVTKPIFKARNFSDGINECSVSLSSFVEKARGTASRSTAGWKVVRHVHDAVAEHRARHQREPRRDRSRRNSGRRIFVVRT